MPGSASRVKWDSRWELLNIQVPTLQGDLQEFILKGNTKDFGFSISLGNIDDGRYDAECKVDEKEAHVTIVYHHEGRETMEERNVTENTTKKMIDSLGKMLSSIGGTGNTDLIAILKPPESWLVKHRSTEQKICGWVLFFADHAVYVNVRTTYRTTLSIISDQTDFENKISIFHKEYSPTWERFVDGWTYNADQRWRVTSRVWNVLYGQENLAKYAEKVLGFLAGSHKRLGQNSHVSSLKDDVMPLIVKHTISSLHEDDVKKLYADLYAQTQRKKASNQLQTHTCASCGKIILIE